MIVVMARLDVVRLLLIGALFGLISPTSSSERCEVNLVPVLNVTTNAAAGWKHFRIKEVDYLAVANFWDGIPEHGMRAKSTLYKVDVIAGNRFPTPNLSRIQEFTTVGAHGWEFIASGEDAFLIVPNYYKCGSNRGPATGSCKSTAIYAFEHKLEQFVSFQSLSTAGPASVTGFTLNGQIYLAIGENFDDKVAIYRLQGRRFVLHQKLDVRGAGVSAFVGFSAHEAYLVSASYHDPTTGWFTRSQLFGWELLSRKFVRIRELATAGAHHVEAFEANFSNKKSKFVVIANDRDESTTKVQSAVYRFLESRDKGVVELHQTIRTDGAHGAAVLTTSHNNVVLAIANFGDRLGKRYQAHSSIYMWNSSNQFELVQEIATLGATDWESFRIGEWDFFAVSNEGADGAPTESVLFYVEERCGLDGGRASGEQVEQLVQLGTPRSEL